MKKTTILLLLILVLSNINVLGDLTTNIDALYNFESNLTNDFGSNHFIQSIAGFTYNSSKIGTKSIGFKNGSTSRVNATLTKSRDVTISFWFYPTFFNINNNILDYSSGSGGWQFSASHLANTWHLMVTNGAQRKVNITTTNCPLNNWCMITGVMNSNNSFYIYVNDTLIQQSTHTFGAPDRVWAVLGNSPYSSPAQEMFMDYLQIWNRSLTSEEIKTLWNNGLGLEYPYILPANTTTFLFSSQTPNDITTTNVITEAINVTYYVNTSYINISTVYLNYSVTGQVFVNDSLYSSYPQSITYTHNNTGNYTFSIEGDHVFPATYPYYHINDLEEIDHFEYFLGLNDYINLSIKNVKNSTSYNLFELMLNTTLGTAELRYCNSSWVGGNPSINSNCYLFATFTGTGFNHSHGKSKHNVYSFPINITSGQIGTVQVTNQSYFLIRGTTAGGTSIWYTNNYSNTVTISTNSGGTFTASNLTFDYHLHQYTTSDSLTYQIFGKNATGVLLNYTAVTDTFDLTIFPPTPVTFTNPSVTNQNVTQFLNITYTPALPIGSATIINYTIDLLNSDLTINTTINKTTNNYYYWNIYNYNLALGIYYLNVTALDSNGLTSTRISEPINITHNGFLNISAYENVTKSGITTFSVNVTDRNTGFTETYTTSSILLFADITKNHNYTVLFDAPGYAYTSINVTPVNTTTNINQSLFLSNSVFIRFLDEITELNITKNITLLIYKEDYVYKNTTVANAYYYNNNFSSGEYTFRYYAGDYLERSYYLDIGSRSVYGLTFYLINTSESSPVQISLRSNFGEIIENATIKLLRYYPSSNSYVTVEMVKTNFDGKGVIQAQLQTTTNNGEYYKFIIEESGSTVLETNPTKITTTTLNFIVVTGATGLEEYKNNLDISYNLSFTDSTNNFKFTFNNANGDFVGGCLYVYETNVISRTLLNTSCVNSSAGTILINVDNSSNKTYTAYAYVYYDTYRYYLSAITKTFDNVAKQTFGKNGVFYAIIIIIAFALIGAYNPTVSIIMASFGLVMTTVIGLLPLTYTIVIGLIAGGIIILWLNKS